MDKPTIFFSHSSKDKDMILPIKKRLEELTAEMISIFMSSDGQSIPFGRNWVSKIEEGLESASVMFIFVTPNSLLSEWIYFEAGYAYSKGIKVIPVGLGVKVQTLKSPLNLLQGFDVTSEDGLNNMISVINKQFSSKFQEGFSEEDYRQMMSAAQGESAEFPFAKYFSRCRYTLKAKYLLAGGGVETYDVDAWYAAIKGYLDGEMIHYGCEQRKIVTDGVVVSLVGSKQYPEEHAISFQLSLLNMREAYRTMQCFLALYEDLSLIEFELKLLPECSAIYRTEDLSAIVSANDELDYAEETTRVFVHKDSIYLWVEEPDSTLFDKAEVLGIGMKPAESSYEDICDLFRLLEKNRVLYMR